MGNLFYECIFMGLLFFIVGVDIFGLWEVVVCRMRGGFV